MWGVLEMWLFALWGDKTSLKGAPVVCASMYTSQWHRKQQLWLVYLFPMNNLAHISASLLATYCRINMNKPKEILIKEVSKYDYFYDSSSQHYKDCQLAANSWKELSTQTPIWMSQSAWNICRGTQTHQRITINVHISLCHVLWIWSRALCIACVQP